MRFQAIGDVSPKFPVDVEALRAAQILERVAPGDALTDELPVREWMRWCLDSVVMLQPLEAVVATNKLPLSFEARQNALRPVAVLLFPGLKKTCDALTGLLVKLNGRLHIVGLPVWKHQQAERC